MMKRIITFALLLVAAVAPLGLRAQDSCTITLPWSENFDSLTAGGTSFVPCWTRVNSVTSGNALLPNVFSCGGTHGNVLNFNGNSTDGTGTMRAATPLISAPLNALELSFTVYKSTLKLYAATNATDLTTYHLIGSYAPGYAWTTYEVRTDTVSGLPSAQGYLIFTADYGTGYGNDNPYLDDLVIVSLNSCERPTSASVENIGPNTATVSWPSVDGAQGYTVSYATVNNIDSAETEQTTYTYLTLTDLEPATQYYVWVKTLCGSGETSDARTATFTTELACYSITGLTQVGTSVDAASFQWEYQNHGHAATGVWAVLTDLTEDNVVVAESVVGTSYIFTGLDRTHQYELTLSTLCENDTAEAVSSSVIFTNCGETELYSGANDHSSDYPMASAYGVSYSVVRYDADVLYSMDTLRGIALHRYLPANASPVTRTLSIYMGHTTLDSLTSNPGTTGLTQVASRVSYTLAAQEWDTLLFTTPFVYDGHSNVLVAVRDSTGTSLPISGAVQWYWHPAEGKMYYSYGTSGITSAYKQPDLRFVGECNNDYSCEPPVVAMGEVDSVNAEVTWYGDASAEYRVEYRSQGGGAWILADIVTGNTYTIEDLNPASHYEVRVGIVCDTLVRYSTTAGFTTLCALLPIPFHFTQNDMIAAATNGFTDCWHWSTYFFKGRLTNSHRGYVRNADLNEWFMLPAVADPLNGVQLRSWISSSDQAWVKVGVASQENCSDVVWVDTVEIPAGTPDYDHNEYIFYLDSYTGTGNRVVVSPIVNNIYHYVFFFDFHLEPISGCRSVTGLTFDSADANSISLHWTPRGEATAWAVYVDGVQVGTATGTPSYTATGLAPYTEYDIAVRTLCADGDTSDAVSGSYRTGCSGEECMVTVHTHAAQGDGWHGARLRVTADGEQVAWFTMRRGSDDELNLRFCADMTVSFDWFSGNDDNLCSFEIVNANGDTLFNTTDATGLDSAFFVSTSICDPIDTTTVRYTVTVNYDNSRGTVIGAGRYNAGTMVTLVATPLAGYHFGGWSNGETDSVYRFQLTSDVTLTATFVENSGIDDAEASRFLLAPNPASSMVTVSGIAAEATVSILDLNGREVFCRKGVNGSLKVDVSDFAKGIYFVQVVSPEAVAVRRLIVK